MKKTLARTTLAAFLFAAMPLSTVHAVVSTSTNQNLTAAQSQRLANLKSKGTIEIDRRIANLNAVVDKLAASNKLSAADKSALTAQIKSEITALTSLKSRLADDTELADARTHVADIVTEYRVYLFVLPKVRLIVTADRFSGALEHLTSLSNQLQSKITTAKTSGHDTATLQATLDHMKSQLETARTQTSGVTAQLLALQPRDYNASHAILSPYRDTLASAQSQLKAARNDAKSIIDGLKNLK